MSNNDPAKRQLHRKDVTRVEDYPTRVTWTQNERAQKMLAHELDERLSLLLGEFIDAGMSDKGIATVVLAVLARGVTNSDTEKAE